jgi:FMN phosphatase YigB (HAD superfamily)
VPFENCLMIDAMIPSLDAARKLGMSTVWLAPVGAEVPDGFPHPVVRSFDELLGVAVTPAP